MKVQQSSIFIQSAHRSSSNDLDRIIRGRSKYRTADSKLDVIFGSVSIFFVSNI